MNLDLQLALKIAIQAAQAAGEVAQKMQDSFVQDSKKGDSLASSVVTDADRKAEEAVRRIILGAFPDHGFVGEEFGKVREGEYCWWVDPIDGTANYVRKSPIYGVNIGLAYNHVPLLGVIHYPEFRETLHAARNQGAWMGGEQLKVSSRSIQEALYISMGISRGKLRTITSLAEQVGGIRILGAGSRGYGEVARGRAEIILGGEGIHDNLAGAVLITEAGGIVTNFEGKPWTTQDTTLLATTPTLFEETLRLINE